MAATIACNLLVAGLDVFSLTLLIPFLQTLFGLQASTTQKVATGGVQKVLDQVLGRFLDASDKMGSLQHVVLVILAVIAVKNIFAWISGQLGASSGASTDN